jgi:hypothetical protein
MINRGGLGAAPFSFRGQMTEKQRTAARTPDALASAWERRTQLVKQELAAASAASDAKTARLKALRLEKERQETIACAELEASAQPARQRKHFKRVFA